VPQTKQLHELHQLHGLHGCISYIGAPALM
jgi:hypothetical protein